MSRTHEEKYLRKVKVEIITQEFLTPAACSLRTGRKTPPSCLKASILKNKSLFCSVSVNERGDMSSADSVDL